MLDHIRFRTRLLLILLTTLGGFVSLSWFALLGLNDQANANRSFQRLSSVTQHLDELTIELMQWTDDRRDLTDETINAYLRSLEQDGQFLLTRLREDQGRLTQPSQTELLTGVEAELTGFFVALTALVDLDRQLGFTAQSGMRGDIDSQGSALLQEVSFLAVVQQAFTAVREAERSFLFDPSEANLTFFDQRFNAFETRINDLNLGERYGERILNYRQAIDAYRAMSQQHQGQRQAFRRTMERFERERRNAADHLRELVSVAAQPAEDQASKTQRFILLLSVLISLSAMALMGWVGLSVRSTLAGIMRDLDQVRAGDLTARLAVDQKRDDEFDHLSRSVNSMTEGLGHIVGGVVSATGQINVRMSELDRAMAMLSDNNGKVTEKTEGLSVATEEISTTMDGIAQNTQALRDQSGQTLESARTGHRTMDDLNRHLSNTMEVVNRASRELNRLGELSGNIDNVVEMINSLAEQTNLLALNAAIEAARAGEAGRGFAVVADEVRSLAERTVTATARIEEDVEAIKSATQSTIETMNNSLQHLTTIETHSKSAVEITQAIEAHAVESSTATTTMADAITEIAKTVRSMSEAMDDMASQLQQDSRALNSMTDGSRQTLTLTQQLTDQVRDFRIQ